MAANAEPLQGSLFGDSEEITNENLQAEKQQSDQKAELSNEALVKDAKVRPRTRQTTTEQEKEAPRSIKDNGSNNDLPAWAHHSLLDINKLTPVLRHYVELKTAHPERVLLYRLGDFFECFFEDAIKLSQVLELTLTGKEGGKAIGRVPMAGIPHHAVERYCGELIKRGLSVALCDQIESSANLSKGSLLKREITRVLTPGTVLEEGLLKARRNNWLAAVVIEISKESDSFQWGLASADISTGEFVLTQRENQASLNDELEKLDASEVLWSGDKGGKSQAWFPEKLHVTKIAKTRNDARSGATIEPVRRQKW